MKKACFKILIGLWLFIQSAYGQAPLAWTTINPGTSGISYSDVFFLNDSVGWIHGSGAFAKTTDGGDSWTLIHSGGLWFNEIFFISEQIGFGVGSSATYAKTEDGGVTWSSLTSPFGLTSHLWNIHFFDSLNGWIGGYEQNYKTTDGGNNWTEIFIPGTSGFDIHFVTPTFGWAASWSSVFYSTDGGTSWNTVSSPTAGTIRAIYAHDQTTVTISDSGGAIFKSTDAGSTWTTQVTSGVSAVTEIDFSGNLGVATGWSGYEKETFDGGLTWHDNPFTSGDCNSVQLMSNGIAFAVIDDQNVYRSQYASNDLYIENYNNADTVCSGVEMDVTVTIKNNGPSPIESATIDLSDGSTDLLSYNWSGYLIGGETTDVLLGAVSLSNSGNYIWTITGDTETANNLSSKFIFVDTTIYASSDQIICAGEQAQITAQGGYTYHWFDMSGDSTLQTQVVAPSQTHEYVVLIKNNFCNILDTVRVEVESCSETVSAFSPNGDGINDFLELSEIPEIDNVLTIYNRWGDEVNSFTNYDNTNVRWEGTDSNGQSLPEGTYFYIFQTSDNSVKFSTWVQIVR